MSRVRITLAVAVALLPSVALVLFLHWRLRGMIFDDAFIHLRIVRNYALTGHAFFNQQQRVMATSSPLWTLLLTLLDAWEHRFILPVVEGLLVLLSGAIAYTLSMKLSHETRRTGQIADAPSNNVDLHLRHLLFGTCTMLLLLPSSIGQMETPLAIALLLGSVLSAIAKRAWALPLLACAAMTRLELLPLFALVVLFALRFNWPKRPLLISLAILASTSLWVYTQFGVLLPNSMHAKAIGYGYGHLEILKQIFAIPALEWPLTATFLVFFTFIVNQTLYAGRHFRWKTATWLPTLAGAWGIFVVMEYVTRKAPVFEWYIPLFWVPILLSLLLYSRPASSKPWETGLVELARWSSLALLLLVPFWKGCMLIRAGWLLTPSSIAEADHQDSERVHEYLIVGSVLQRTCPTGILMTSEIGALGWSFPGSIQDAFGIATPRAIAFQPLRSGAPVGGVPAAYALEANPDIIVSFSSLDAEVRASRQLYDSYSLIALPTTIASDHVPTTLLGWHKSTAFDVFVRKGGACNLREVESALPDAVTNN